MTVKEELLKTVELTNRQRIEIFDISRKISTDAYLVAMVARMTVNIEAETLKDTELGTTDNSTDIDKIISKLGNQVSFEYRNERNFIMNEDKDRVFQNLVESFLKNMTGYLSKESFPGKLILKKYDECTKSRYRRRI